MTITLHWWFVPVLLVITGYILAAVYYESNFSDGSYFPDLFSGLVATGIFLVFVIAAFFICIGVWIA